MANAMVPAAAALTALHFVIADERILCMRERNRAVTAAMRLATDVLQIEREPARSMHF